MKLTIRSLIVQVPALIISIVGAATVSAASGEAQGLGWAILGIGVCGLWFGSARLEIGSESVVARWPYFVKRRYRFDEIEVAGLGVQVDSHNPADVKRAIDVANDFLDDGTRTLSGGALWAQITFHDGRVLRLYPTPAAQTKLVRALTKAGVSVVPTHIANTGGHL